MTDPQPVLHALADPTRRAVFERLSSRGPASASALANEMPVSRQAIAKHLNVLGDAGLVDRQSSGRQVIYEANLEALDGVSGWISDVGDQWDRRLERLKRSFAD